MVARAPLSIVDRDSITVDNGVLNPVPVVLTPSGTVQDVNIVSSVALTVNQGTSPWLISANTLPLPTGAATAAKQLPDNHQVTVSNFPATQAVSGNLGRTWNLLFANDKVDVSGSSVSVTNFPAVQTVSVNNFPTTQAISGAVSVNNFPATQAVSGNLGRTWALSSATDSVNVGNFPAVQAVSQSGVWDINNITGTVSLPTGAATAAKQLPDNHQVTVSNFPAKQNVNVLNQLIPVEFDQIDLSYTGANITSVLYKKAGVTVATLTLSYTGANLTSVLRS